MITVTDLLADIEPVVRGWIAQQIGDHAATNDPGDQFGFEFTSLSDGDMIYYEGDAYEWKNTSALQHFGGGAEESVLFFNTDMNVATNEISYRQFKGRDDGDVRQEYARIVVSIVSPAAGSEEGKISFYVADGGAATEQMHITSDTLTFPAAATITTGAGDLTLSAAGNVVISAAVTYDGAQIIDVTDTEAFLVRANADSDDVLIVDTTNERVGIGGVPSHTLHIAPTGTETTSLLYVAGTTSSILPIAFVPSISAANTTWATYIEPSFTVTAANKSLYGMYYIGKLAAGAHNVTRLYASEYKVQTLAGYSDTLTGAAAVSVATPSFAGSGPTTLYGLLIANQTGASGTSYAIYTGTGFNRFGDYMTIVQDSTTGAQPVLALDQDDISEEFIRFTGSAAAGVLTQSIVDEGDQASETEEGFVKVYVVDEGNQITDQAYFLKLYTLAA